MGKLGCLLKVQLLGLFGINRILHGEDRRGRNRLVLFGLAAAVLAAVVALYAAGTAQSLVLVGAGRAIPVLAVAVGYAVVFTEADANALVQIVPFKHKTPFKAKCLSVAQTYQLSPRETEIALLIAQGRDSAHIEKKLFLSRSTVQTHRMHLYQKLDIHNRQELLDIIEAAEAVGASSAR